MASDKKVAAAALCAALCLGVSAQTSYAVTAEEVQAFMGHAVNHFKEVGKERAFQDFNNAEGEFNRGELYIFCKASNGVMVAQAANPKLVGRNFGNILDPDGKSPDKELDRVAKAYGQGWATYRWINPVSKKVQMKSVWVVQVDDDTVCGSGYYHD